MPFHYCMGLFEIIFRISVKFTFWWVYVGSYMANNVNVKKFSFGDNHRYSN